MEGEQALRFRDYLEQVKSYYAQHVPLVEFDLRDRAAKMELKAYEARLGRELPAELVDVLENCNGQGLGHPIFPMLRVEGGYATTDPHWLLGLADIELDTNLLNEEFFSPEARMNTNLEFRPFGPVQVHDSFIQITETASPGLLALDGCPTAGGQIDQVVYISTQPLEIAFVANSLSELYDRILRSFENGNIIYDPTIDDAHYRFRES